ncbi:aldo/keto reductase [Enterovirga rhinocerotis]|uniref:Diketogulonate reductase-like aldo/keto reductase n=1 Tax=Enterovirga rhinocerotis TaxID=1339210 RepID=A0A4R7C7U4_9HYPH|nr:aldo/keto reductase [Enterovirga rhinocerotis]TDR94498.1 diketogulonate reductase-like aldo/keto reductase [Enterovirga rhinocerotis]
MPKAHLVQANGATIPAIGLGTFKLEGEACAQAVSTAIEAGYRHVDTAKMYGNEAAVGEGLRASGVPRDEIFVTTKVWWEDIAPGDLERSAEASLGRLGLDAVDLLLIHWPNPAISLAGSIEALCRAKTKGLARHIGISNFPTALIREALDLATEPLVANQVEYHPWLDQSAVLAACREGGLALTSYCPLGRGELVNDPAVIRIAEAHGKTPGQIILRWQVQQPGVVAIPKSGTPRNILANLDVFDFALGEDEMKTLSALARPNGRMVKPDFAPAWD